MNRTAPWESEHGTVDIEKYNRSLKQEPERDRLRIAVTSSAMRERALRDTPGTNGAPSNNGYPYRNGWPE